MHAAEAAISRSPAESTVAASVRAVYAAVISVRSTRSRSVVACAARPPAYRRARSRARVLALGGLQLAGQRLGPSRAATSAFAATVRNSRAAPCATMQAVPGQPG